MPQGLLLLPLPLGPSGMFLRMVLMIHSQNGIVGLPPDGGGLLLGGLLLGGGLLLAGGLPLFGGLLLGGLLLGGALPLGGGPLWQVQPLPQQPQEQLPELPVLVPLPELAAARS